MGEIASQFFKSNAYTTDEVQRLPLYNENNSNGEKLRRSYAQLDDAWDQVHISPFLNVDSSSDQSLSSSDDDVVQMQTSLSDDYTSYRQNEIDQHLLQVTSPSYQPYAFQFPRSSWTTRNDNESKGRREESSMNDCFICCRRKKYACLLHGNTGHQVCCVPCDLRLKKLWKPCPVCRSAIKRVVRIYEA